MLVKLLKSKIHRAKVTQADLNYVGSITIDRKLMEAANILPNEAVLVADVDNGTRHVTYAIPGEPGSGIICINGAAARLVHIGDIVLIMAFGYFDEKEAQSHQANIVIMNEENNTIKEIIHY